MSKKAPITVVRKKGHPRSFKSPEELMNHFRDYCEWVDKTPWTKKQYVGKEAVEVEMEYRRPYTWEGFDNYLYERKISASLDHYKYNKLSRYDEFQPVIRRIDSIIRDNKMTGAYVGFFQAAIVAPDLGLNREFVNPNGGISMVVLNLGGGIDPATGLPVPEPETNFNALEEEGEYYIDFEEVEDEEPLEDPEGLLD